MHNTSTFVRIADRELQELPHSLNGDGVDDGIIPMSEKERLDFKEKLREFNKTHALEVRKVDLQERKNKEDAKLKSRQISKMGRTSKK